MKNKKKSNSWNIEFEDILKLKMFALNMFNFLKEKDLLNDFNLWLFEDLDKNIYVRNKKNGI